MDCSMKKKFIIETLVDAVVSLCTGVKMKVSVGIQLSEELDVNVEEHHDLC